MLVDKNATIQNLGKKHASWYLALEESNLMVIRDFFNALDEKSLGFICKSDITKLLHHAGIADNDPRIAETYQLLAEFDDEHQFDLKTFERIVRTNFCLLESCLRGHFVIPNFHEFCNEIKELYEEVKKIEEGSVADYIPQLQRANPDHFGMALCTVDGQKYAQGEANEFFCVQSTCKPINYCFALELRGEEAVHRYIGREPSGSVFNELKLNNANKPHNPMINSGAIMCCSLIAPELNSAERFDYVLSKWQQLAAGQRPKFNNSVYLSEKETADRNFALAYFMREKKSFPEETNLLATLDFYFQCCSIEVDCEMLSVIAATLANGGVNPFNGERVLSAKTVQNCLSLMSTCGMYDFSGEFAFQIGLPAKSGVSGALIVVIPNVMGIALWSPKLDESGNTVRGVEFCRSLVRAYNFHNFDSLGCHMTKKDPRKRRVRGRHRGSVELCWAASHGDLTELKRLVASAVSLNAADYDGRTPLHLSASEGHYNVVKYLLLKNVEVNPLDRWGFSPLDDAIKLGDKRIVALLEQHGAKRASDQYSASDPQTVSLK